MYKQQIGIFFRSLVGDENGIKYYKMSVISLRLKEANKIEKIRIFFFFFSAVHFEIVKFYYIFFNSLCFLFLSQHQNENKEETVFFFGCNLATAHLFFEPVDENKTSKREEEN